MADEEPIIPETSDDARHGPVSGEGLNDPAPESNQLNEANNKMLSEDTSNKMDDVNDKGTDSADVAQEVSEASNHGDENSPPGASGKESAAQDSETIEDVADIETPGDADTGVQETAAVTGDAEAEQAPSSDQNQDSPMELGEDAEQEEQQNTDVTDILKNIDDHMADQEIPETDEVKTSESLADENVAEISPPTEIPDQVEEASEQIDSFESLQEQGVMVEDKTAEDDATPNEQKDGPEERADDTTNENDEPMEIQDEAEGEGKETVDSPVEVSNQQTCVDVSSSSGVINIDDDPATPLQDEREVSPPCAELVNDDQADAPAIVIGEVFSKASETPMETTAEDSAEKDVTELSNKDTDAAENDAEKNTVEASTKDADLTDNDVVITTKEVSESTGKTSGEMKEGEERKEDEKKEEESDKIVNESDVQKDDKTHENKDEKDMEVVSEKVDKVENEVKNKEAALAVTSVQNNDTKEKKESTGTILQASSIKKEIPDKAYTESTVNNGTTKTEGGKDTKPAIPANEKKPVATSGADVTKSSASAPKPTPKSQQQCIVCKKVGKCKYNIVRNGDIKHLCDDACFKVFRSSPTAFLRNENSKSPITPGNPTPASTPATSIVNINTTPSSQTTVKTSPTKLPVVNRKCCASCGKSVIGNPDSFLAPIGRTNDFKDFCGQACLQKFEQNSPPDDGDDDIEIVGVSKVRPRTRLSTGHATCAVCGKMGAVKHEVNFDNKTHKLCSDPCFAAFRYANKLTMNTCENCGVYCYGPGMKPHYIQFEGQQKRFCSTKCVDTFKKVKSKTVPCAWCSTKKSNFDMIERVDANNKYQLFCSLNCLSLYRVNLQATSNQSVTCDHCKKNAPAQYHLTMSDASVRNFCCYSCVMSFQGQYTNSSGQQNNSTPHANTSQQSSAQTTQNKANTGNRPVRAAAGQAKQQIQQIAAQLNGTDATGGTSIPVISNVMSLATGNAAPQTPTTIGIKPTKGRPPSVNSVTSPQNQVNKKKLADEAKEQQFGDTAAEMLVSREPNPSVNSDSFWHRRAVDVFMQYLGHIGERGDFLNYNEKKLDEHLSTFWSGVWEMETECPTDNTRSLISIRRRLNGFLQEHRKHFDIIQSPSFAKSQQAFATAIEELTAPKNDTVQISNSDLQKLYSHKLLSRDLSPRSLFQKVQFDIRFNFFQEKVENFYRLTKSSFQVKIDPSTNLKYVCKHTQDKLEKDKSNNEFENTSHFMLEMPDDPRCPVASFEKYLSKLDPASDRLWQKPVNRWLSHDPVWYHGSLVRRTLSKFMSILSKTCELSRVYNNESISVTGAHFSNERLNIASMTSPINVAPMEAESSGGYVETAAVSAVDPASDQSEDSRESQNTENSVGVIPLVEGESNVHEYRSSPERKVFVEEESRSSNIGKDANPQPSKSGHHNQSVGNLFKKFLIKSGKDEDFLKYSESELDEQLSLYWLSARTENGKMYSSTSLTAMRYRLQNFLRENNKEFNILRSPSFAKSQESFTVALDLLGMEGKGVINHHTVFSDADLKKLYNSDKLSPDASPRSLFNKVHFDIRFHFLLNSTDNMLKMTKNTFQIETDPITNRRYLYQCVQKGKKKLNRRMEELPGNPKCPLASYEKYLSKLNPLCERLWQRQKLSLFPESAYWYTKPVGFNTICTFMTNLSKECRLSKVYSNYSISMSGGDDNRDLDRFKQIMALTGQGNASASLLLYPDDSEASENAVDHPVDSASYSRFSKSDSCDLENSQNRYSTADGNYMDDDRVVNKQSLREDDRKITPESQNISAATVFGSFPRNNDKSEDSLTESAVDKQTQRQNYPMPAYKTSIKIMQAMKGAAKTFRYFLRDNGESEDFLNFTEEKLDDLLSKFWFAARKDEGGCYKAGSLGMLRYRLSLFIKENNGDVDIINSPAFVKSQEAFSAAADILVKEGKGITTVPSITDADLQKLYSNRNLSPDLNPKTLFNKVQFDIRFYFSQQTPEDFLNMTKDTFYVATDPATKMKCVYKRDERNLKETSSKNNIQCMPEMPGNPRCPVASFLKYVSKLNPACNSLWQRQRSTMWISTDRVWYGRAMGVNVLSTFMSDLSKTCKLSQVYKNHSLRITGSSAHNRNLHRPMQIMAAAGFDKEHGSLPNKPVFHKIATMGMEEVQPLSASKAIASKPLPIKAMQDVTRLQNPTTDSSQNMVTAGPRSEHSSHQPVLFCNESANLSSGIEQTTDLPNQSNTGDSISQCQNLTSDSSLTTGMTLPKDEHVPYPQESSLDHVNNTWNMSTGKVEPTDGSHQSKILPMRVTDNVTQIQDAFSDSSQIITGHHEQAPFASNLSESETCNIIMEMPGPYVTQKNLPETKMEAAMASEYAVDHQDPYSDVGAPSQWSTDDPCDLENSEQSCYSAEGENADYDASTLNKQSLRSIKGNKAAAKTFRLFLRDNDESEDFLNFTTEKLDDILCKFWFAARTEDGDYYKATSLKMLRYRLNLYMKDMNSDMDIIRSYAFVKSQEAFLAAFEDLVKKGKGTISYPQITDADLQKVYSGCHLSPDLTPKSLFNKVQFDIRFYFYQQGSEGFQNMTKDTFYVATDPATKRRCVYKRDEKSKKKLKEILNKNNIQCMPEMPGNPHCPVASFEKYVSKLDPECNSLWQRQRSTLWLSDGVWYSKAVGLNALSTFMSELSKVCKLSQVYSNHSIRITGSLVHTRNLHHPLQVMAVAGRDNHVQASFPTNLFVNETVNMGMAGVQSGDLATQSLPTIFSKDETRCQNLTYDSGQMMATHIQRNEQSSLQPILYSNETAHIGSARVWRTDPPYQSYPFQINAGESVPDLSVRETTNLTWETAGLSAEQKYLPEPNSGASMASDNTTDHQGTFSDASVPSQSSISDPCDLENSHRTTCSTRAEDVHAVNKSCRPKRDDKQRTPDERCRIMKGNKSAAKAFSHFLRESDESDDFLNFTEEKLDGLLSKYWFAARTVEGEYYSKSTLTTMRYRLDDYIKRNNKKLDILRSPAFAKSQEAFSVAIDVLEKEGKGITKYPQITDADLKKLYSNWNLSCDISPKTLYNKVQFDIRFYFCQRGPDNLLNMTKDTFYVSTDSGTRRKCVYKRDEKLNGGQSKSVNKNLGRCMPAMPGNPRCPVASFEKYISKLDPECNSLWQRQRRTKWLSTDSVWYSKAVGTCALSTFMSDLSKACQLSQVYTNHSLRMTGSYVHSRNLPGPKHIMAMTGIENEETPLGTNLVNETGNTTASEKALTTAVSVPAKSQPVICMEDSEPCQNLRTSDSSQIKIETELMNEHTLTVPNLSADKSPNTRTEIVQPPGLVAQSKFHPMIARFETTHCQNLLNDSGQVPLVSDGIGNDQMSSSASLPVNEPAKIISETVQRQALPIHSGQMSFMTGISNEPTSFIPNISLNEPMDVETETVQPAALADRSNFLPTIVSESVRQSRNLTSDSNQIPHMTGLNNEEVSFVPDLSVNDTLNMRMETQDLYVQPKSSLKTTVQTESLCQELQENESADLKPSGCLSDVRSEEITVNEASGICPQNISHLDNEPHMPLPQTLLQTSAVSTGTSTTVQKQIIVQPPPPKQVKNKALLCKPFFQTKATSCRPHTQNMSTQTEETGEAKQILVPVPVPFYIPVPMAMYTSPTPYPLPIPVPIPVPCFIPTTKKSADGILKHIKEIQEKIPADPFEAELLMMAEAVANADKSDEESEKSDEEDATPAKDDEVTVTMEPEQSSEPVTTATVPDGVLGEDMLQMALRMATEMTEPVLDLEDSLPASSIKEDEDMDSDKESNPSQTDYDEEFKQEVVNVATRTSYTVAAREYGLSENQVKDWGRNSIKRKPAQQRAKHQVEQTAQKRFECVVKEWVISQTAKGAELCSTQVREHALKLLKNDDFGFQKPFLASKSWCMRFIRRNRLLELRKSKPIQMIPVDDAGKLSMLRSIIMKKCEHWEYNLSQIGFMEEVTIGLDTEGATVESAISRSDETVFSVVLSCLADGTKLKPVIVVRGTRQRKVIEDLDGIHLHSQAEGLVDESAVLFFVEKIWSEKLQSKRGKPSLLIWDQARSHLVKRVQTILEDSDVKQALIPGGPAKMFPELLKLLDCFKELVCSQRTAWLNEHASEEADVVQWVKDAWESVNTEEVRNSVVNMGIKESKENNAEVRSPYTPSSVEEQQEDYNNTYSDVENEGKEKGIVSETRSRRGIKRSHSSVSSSRDVTELLDLEDDMDSRDSMEPCLSPESLMYSSFHEDESNSSTSAGDTSDSGSQSHISEKSDLETWVTEECEVTTPSIMATSMQRKKVVDTEGDCPGEFEGDEDSRCTDSNESTDRQSFVDEENSCSSIASTHVEEDAGSKVCAKDEDVNIECLSTSSATNYIPLTHAEDDVNSEICAKHEDAHIGCTSASSATNSEIRSETQANYVKDVLDALADLTSDNEADFERINEHKHGSLIRDLLALNEKMETRLKQWIFGEIVKHHLVTENGIKKQALKLVRESAGDKLKMFTASSDWLDCFMKRHNLKHLKESLRPQPKKLSKKERKKASRKAKKRSSLDSNNKSSKELKRKKLIFSNFISNHCGKIHYNPSQIGIMHELKIILDLNVLQTIRFSVMLAFFADGRKLQPMILFKKSESDGSLTFPTGASVSRTDRGLVSKLAVLQWIQEIWNRRQDDDRLDTCLLILDMKPCHLGKKVDKALLESNTQQVFLVEGLPGILPALEHLLNVTFIDKVSQLWKDCSHSEDNEQSEYQAILCVKNAWEDLDIDVIKSNFSEVCIKYAQSSEIGTEHASTADVLSGILTDDIDVLPGSTSMLEQEQTSQNDYALLGNVLSDLNIAALVTQPGSQDVTGNLPSSHQMEHASYVKGMTETLSSLDCQSTSADRQNIRVCPQNELNYDDETHSFNEEDDYMNENCNDYTDFAVEISPDVVTPSTSKQSSYNVDFKLEAIALVEATSVKTAAKRYDVRASLLRSWRRKKEQLLQLPGSKKRDRQSGSGYFLTLDAKLYEWVLSQQADGISVTRKMAREKAIELSKEDEQCAIKKFSGSWSWLSRFQQRYDVTLSNVRHVVARIPDAGSQSLVLFQNFVANRCQNMNFNLSQIAMMEELKFDLDLTSGSIDLVENTMTPEADSPGQKITFTVLLTCLADGSKLKPMIMFQKSGKDGSRHDYPKGVVVSSSYEAKVDEEAVLLWIRKIWCKHQRPLSGASALLILDATHSQLHNKVREVLTECNTQQAFLPAGLSNVYPPLKQLVQEAFRNSLHQHLSDWCRSDDDDDNALSLPLAAWWVKRSWEDLDTGAIPNGFVEAGIKHAPEQSKVNVKENTVTQNNEKSEAMVSEPPAPLEKECDSEAKEDHIDLSTARGVVMETEISSDPEVSQIMQCVPTKDSELSTINTSATDVLSEPVTTRRGRGQKRGATRGRGRPKRQRIEEPVEEVSNAPPPADANMVLKFTYGVNAWKHWVILKNSQLEKASKSTSRLKLFKTDILQCTADELNYSLCLFVKEVRKPNGEEYNPDSIYYLCLGIQQYLFENGRIDNIFTDVYYEKFTECLNEVVAKYEVRLNSAGLLVCRIEEEHLWESKQLGAHSPHVLLNTLVYFNTKYFMLRTCEDHIKLSFSHIMKHWKKTTAPGTKTPGRSVYLRYYAPSTVPKAEGRKKREELPVYEQGENVDNPLRCPVKLYEFYVSKCPESIKNRNDVFYLVPERSCVPDSPVWYSTNALGMEHMSKMMNRTRTIKEIQESFVHSPNVYIS